MTSGPSAIVQRWVSRSGATRSWSPPDRQPFGGGGRLGGTWTRGPAPDAPLLVLLHGLSEGGSAFGSHYDTLPATVVVPDLPGFGRSLQVQTPGYRTRDHVRALVGWLDAVHPDREVVLAGHSMGGLLALHTAAAMPGRTRGVVAISAGMYDTRREGMAHIRASTPVMSRLTEGRVAEVLCTSVCGRPHLGAVAWTLLGLQWPGAVARGGARHTWRSFSETLEDVVLASGYRDVLAELAEAGVPVSLLNGTADRMQVPGRAAALAAELPNVALTTIEGAGHAPHILDPGRCADHLAACLAAWTRTPGSATDAGRPAAGRRPAR